jgi:hypothetical protein
MDGNNSIFGGEKSFFGTTSFNREDIVNNQKEGTKNSSNPEKEYER